MLKRSAAEPGCSSTSGPAVVFKDHHDLLARIDDPDLPVTPDSVLVLQDAGPIGAPGMPEWGMLPIPKKLLEAGVRDMVRISDARMSGTSYGTCVLHVCPESRVGGPLGLVRDGDLIRLDAAARRLDLLVDDAEIGARRRARGRRRRAHYERGYGAMFSRTCCRPTRAATSTSWRGRGSSRSRRSIERGGAGAPDQRLNQLPDAIALTIVTP